MEMPNLRVTLSHPRIIKSSGEETFLLNIRNNRETALYNLELSAFNNDGLEIFMDITKIDRIERNETFTVSMRVINNHSRYFRKNSAVTISISNENFMIDHRFTLTIEPVENFWLLVIIAVAFLLAVLLSIIFIRLNKEEK